MWWIYAFLSILTFSSKRIQSKWILKYFFFFSRNQFGLFFFFCFPLCVYDCEPEVIHMLCRCNKTKLFHLICSLYHELWYDGRQTVNKCVRTKAMQLEVDTKNHYNFNHVLFKWEVQVHTICIFSNFPIDCHLKRRFYLEAYEMFFCCFNLSIFRIEYFLFCEQTF